MTIVDKGLRVEPNADKEVLEFIERFLSGGSRDTMARFNVDYSWHFAHMLKSTFGRGFVCYAYPVGRFVWCGALGIPYYIAGVYAGSATYYLPDLFMSEGDLGRHLWYFKFGKVTEYSISSVNVEVLEVAREICKEKYFEPTAWLCNLTSSIRNNLLVGEPWISRDLNGRDMLRHIDTYRSLAKHLTPEYFNGPDGSSCDTLGVNAVNAAVAKMLGG